MSRIGDIVGEGAARIVATGYTFGIPDAGAIAMREDFMKSRPDIVEAWLKTELEAQQYVVDPKNWTKVAEFVKDQTQGITVPMAWFSIYGAIPPAAGGSPIRDEKPFVFDDRVKKLLAETYVYLKEAKAIDVDKPAPGALDDSIARKVAATRKCRCRSARSRRRTFPKRRSNGRPKVAFIDAARRRASWIEGGSLVRHRVTAMCSGVQS